MKCLKCDLHIKGLTKYRFRFKEFCTCNSDYPNKYHVDLIKIGEYRIYPWTNTDKCYNPYDSRVIRQGLRNYIKKHAGQFWIRKHLAGMQVFRIA